jgi:hypothetical protein
MTQRDPSDSPRRVPIGIRLKVRDELGRELVYAHRWDAVEEETKPGQRGVWLSTGTTGDDGQGVRAEVEVHVGIYNPDGPPDKEPTR